MRKAVKKKNIVKKSDKKQSMLALVCLLTGEVVRMSSAQAQKQCIKYKFNDITDYVKNYISRSARVQLTQGLNEKQIREGTGNRDLPAVSYDVIRHYVKKVRNTQKAEKNEKRRLAQEFVASGEGAYIVKQNNRVSVNFKDSVQVASLTQSACMRPDIYLNNDRFCNGCTLYDLCACRLRRWSNKIDVPEKNVISKKKKK